MDGCEEEPCVTQPRPPGWKVLTHPHLSLLAGCTTPMHTHTTTLEWVHGLGAGLVGAQLPDHLT